MKIYNIFYFATIISIFSIPSFSFAQDNNVRIEFNGFGDLMAGLPFGTPANHQDNALFKKYNDNEYPYDIRRGLMVHGLDLLNTVFLNDNVKIQTEVNIEGSRNKTGGDMEFEVDRCYIDYTITANFGIQGGLIFTPIGYINRALYSRAWLSNSAHIYQAVENKSGLIQSHFVGVAAYGTMYETEGKAITYTIGAGMPRPSQPTDQPFNSDQLGYQFTSLLELHTTGEENETRFGLSGYTSQIHTFNVNNYGDVIDITSATAQPIVLQETGFNPYLVRKGKKIDILFEYNYVLMNNLNNTNQTTTNLNCISAEIALNKKILNRRFAPYIRYDYIALPENGGPYYGLRNIGNNQLTKVYSPDFNVLICGIAYDIFSYNRIKLEYLHHFDGPFITDGIFFQTAFGF